ncbi:hypothetical protein SLE2022_176280 [Rubroshorea leprosula]
MAQKTEKEETEFKVPETLTLCVNNCGVTGNPATKNMCQKCFNSTTATTSSSSSSSPSSTSNATSGGGAVAGGASSVMKFSGEPSSRSGTSRSLEIRSDSVSGTTTTSSQSSLLDNSGVETLSMVEKKLVNRCSGCKKRVGLTGFRCRCGELFCAEHRYSDRHDCSYDYKAAGREAIARENPVVKAAKIVKV